MPDMRSLLALIQGIETPSSDRFELLRSLNEDMSRGERYRGVVEPIKGRRYGTIEITKPLRAYHASHEDAGLILTDRAAKTYDSIGTWLSSNREIAQRTYGPNVSAYEVPAGRYMLMPRDKDLRETILNCFPMIERILGADLADQIAEFPDTAKNRAWMADVKARAKAAAVAAGEDEYGDKRHFVRDLLRDVPGGWKRYQGLDARHSAYAKVARSAEYSKQFKAWMIQCQYTGMIWNNRHWDTKEGRQTIFLIFKHDDLHPIEVYPKAER